MCYKIIVYLSFNTQLILIITLISHRHIIIVHNLRKFSLYSYIFYSF